MIRRPPRSKRTDTLFPDTTRFRSDGVRLDLEFEPEQAKKVPANSTVRVLPVSIFGAAYVELLRPKSSTGVLTDDVVLKQDESATTRSEEHTSELQSLMRSSYAVFCLKKKTHTTNTKSYTEPA